MHKLKKTLLISSLILLASCDKGLPDAPESLQVVPIWSDNTVDSFYGRWMVSGEKVDMSLPQAKEASLVCTDLGSRTRMELHIKELRKLAEKRCK